MDHPVAVDGIRHKLVDLAASRGEIDQLSHQRTAGAGNTVRGPTGDSPRSRAPRCVGTNRPSHQVAVSDRADLSIHHLGCALDGGVAPTEGKRSPPWCSAWPRPMVSPCRTSPGPVPVRECPLS